MRLNPFTALWSAYRRKFPKKGSINWVIKTVNELAKHGHEIAILDGKASIKLKEGKYTQSIQLVPNVSFSVDVIGSGGGGGSGKVPYSGEGARSMREAIERQWPD